LISLILTQGLQTINKALKNCLVNTEILKKDHLHSIAFEVLSSYFYLSLDLGFDKFREVAPLSRK